MTAASTSVGRTGGSGRRAVTLTAAIGLAGVLLAALGVVLAARPVHTPTQDCGSAVGYLLRGGVDEFVDPNDPPAGTSASEALSNNNTPCQERAANQARPGGFLVVGGIAVALVALVAEVVVRFRIRRAHRAAPSGPADPSL